MTDPLKIFSPAKVNIGLQIRNKRSDGFHNIHTIFQELEFADIVTLEPAEEGCRITANVDWVPVDESNICHKIYRILLEKYPDLPGIKIHLEKNIPAGAGLGGGSGNGAVALKGLNKMFNLGLDEDEMQKMGAAVGADVAFFIRGGTQEGNGIGDELNPLAPLRNLHFLLVIPQIHINTGWAYGEAKKNLDLGRELINFPSYFRDENTSWEFFENDFERIVIPAYPEIGVIKNRLLEAGAVYAGLSGSGSTVYGIFDDEAAARAGESVFKNSYQTILTHPPQA